MVEIFEITMKISLMNVNVLTKELNTSIWTLYTYKPYMRSCNSFEIQKIETFTSVNYTNDLNDLMLSENFPTQELIFNNCPLFISTFFVPPYVIIRNFYNGSFQYDGIDVVIVNEISKTLNLIPIYMQAPDNQKRGFVFDNGTATGAIKMVSLSN